MYYYGAILLFVGLIMLTACEKFPLENLQGYWRPIYVSGYDENDVYDITYDGPVDKFGLVKYVRASKSVPGIKEEGTMVIPSICFFRENGEDMYCTFFVNGSDVRHLLHYYIKNGKIYRELSMSELTNADNSQVEYDEGAPIQFLGDNQVKIGDITYERM